MKYEIFHIKQESEQRKTNMKTRLTNKLHSAIVIAFLLTTFISTGFAGQPFSNAATASAQASSEVKLPDTPAGKTFAAFLKAFNTGDVEILKKFHTDHGGNPANAQKDLDFYQQSGGIKVISVGKSTDYTLELVIETKNGSEKLNLSIAVTKEAPYALQMLRIEPA
jgi:hypothetical protein